LTNSKSPAYDFGKQAERPKLSENDMNGPGSYQIQDLFGHNLNDVTIGVRREEI